MSFFQSGSFVWDLDMTIFHSVFVRLHAQRRTDNLRILRLYRERVADFVFRLQVTSLWLLINVL